MKKLLTALLTLALALTCICLCSTRANAATVDSGTCGANLTWTLDDAGTLTISGTGAIYDYWDAEDIPWYGHRIEIKTIIIGDKVTTIGAYAFDSCSSLTSVTIPDSVTTIGACAFYSCTSLTSVTIPDSVTTIGDYAFTSCTSLIGIYVHENNPIYSSDDRGVLFNKKKTMLMQAPGGINDSYTIPDSVTTIGIEAFSYCTSLTSVTIGDSVTAIGESAFSWCTSLTSATIPDSVTTIDHGAFDSCSSLENVYYAGTSNQWSAISIGSDNTCLTNATIHCVHIHDYSLLPPVTVAATCAKTGYIEYTCIYGETHREILPQLPHSYPETGTVVAPTCTQEGYTDVTCTRCGAVHKKDPVPALGHDYNGLQEVVESTCTTEGYTNVSCTRCNSKEKRDIVAELGHSMVEIPAVAPTCTETGLTAGTHCEHCQMAGIAQTVIPATGHSFADGICSACGEPECAPGDLTGDGNINSLDGLLLMRYLNGWDVNITAEAAMDVNGDGNVNSLDGLLLMRYLNGWNVELG